MYRRRSQCCPGYFESGDLCVREYPLFNFFNVDDGFSGCQMFGEQEEMLAFIFSLGDLLPACVNLLPNFRLILCIISRHATIRVNLPTLR